MRVLLDTHILLWTFTDVQKLGRTLEIIESGADEVLFSTASIWEIAIKVSLGRPDFVVDPADMFQAARRSGYIERAITAEVAIRVAGLPLYHRDPFDRLIVAQAIAESATLITADPKLVPYSDLVQLIQ